MILRKLWFGCVRVWLGVLPLGFLAGLPAAVYAGQLDIAGPSGSVLFGDKIKVLPNGNFVVTDPGYSPDNQSHISRIYLYSPSGSLISTLEKATRFQGQGGVYVLSSGNFVVCSPGWVNDSNEMVGAVTWVNGATGLDGSVSASNSLIGTHDGDQVCAPGIAVLTNGNYVVSSAYWNSDTDHLVGAATWCNGSTGCRGTVSAQNSLIGSSAGDYVSGGDTNNGITVLSNGNYVVASSFWSNGNIFHVGAVTLCSGNGGCTGAISSANSLIGSSAGDYVGNSTGFYAGTTALADGNFVVVSQYWHNAGSAHVGAVTWVDGQTGLIGAVSSTNSLFGLSEGDLQNSSVTPLSNGNYVVNSPNWDNGSVVDVGAATWCHGAAGCAGPIGTAAALVGSSAHDQVGTSPAAALANGNYVVASPYWNNIGVPEVGAATWCSGVSGCSGSISSANSLIGASAYDTVSIGGVTALSSGNYVVTSPYWSNGTGGISQVGAATWCSGSNGCTGPTTLGNSLTGSFTDDEVGYGRPGTRALTNGNYVVYSNHWHDGMTQVGAVTWGYGESGLAGSVAVADSFIGITTDDYIPGEHVFPLANGNYVVFSPSWQNGSTLNAGAVTLLRGYGPQSGTISASNSAVGNIENGGQLMSFDYDAVHDRLVVGKPKESIVTILAVDQLFFNGFN